MQADVQVDELRRRPGRPRSAQAQQAILEATLLTLVDVGYEALSIEGIAARAGVGKATIYRRWAGKEELVAAALSTLNGDVDVPDTGNVHTDLTLMIERFQRSTLGSAIGPMIARLVGSTLQTPRIVELFLENVGIPRACAIHDVIERGKLRGEVRSDVDTHLIIDMIAGIMLGRVVLYGTDAARSPDLPKQVADVLVRGIAPRSES